MTTTTGIALHDQNLEKQIEKHMGGCMAGFFNLFDRSHLLSGKRLYPKRLPPSLTPSMVGDSASESISAVGSPPPSTEQEKPEKPQPDHRPPSPAASPAKSPWKFNKEAPRLSLDSRAITDAKGGLRPREIRIITATTAATAADESKDNQRQSPSVIARLMGLEQLPSSANEPEKNNNVELRRSASESRSRDYRFFDTPSFLSPVTTKSENVGERKSDQMPVMNRNHHIINNNNNSKNSNNVQKLRNQGVNSNFNSNSNNQRRMMVERRSYYDTADFFPPEVAVKQQQQQQNQAVTIYGEIERRLKMRGIDEPSKDLETLKHILEALQLKGLLHSSTNTTDPRHNRRFSHDEERESPVVLMRPARSPASNNTNTRRRNASVNNTSSSGESPRRERAPRSPMRSPGRSDNRSFSPVVRRKGGPLSVETQRRSNDITTTVSSSSRVSHSPVHSPKSTTTTTVIRRSDQTVNRSPRNRRSTGEMSQGERVHSGPAFAEDEASTTISESSFSTSSHTDNERWRGEEYRDGKNLLERCDKLLNSIAEITANANSNSNSNSAELQQPSPVSVLDSSFYKEDESSPSPVKKRTIDFKDQVVMELEDELLWSPSSTIQLSKLDHDLDSSDDSEFNYVSEVLRASNYLPDDSNLFLLLEKQSSIRGNRDKSKTSILQRKLIFDTITEILDRNQQLPPWKTVSISNSTSAKPTLEQIWSEFQKIRERGPSEDLFEVICGVLKKDLAGDSINGWADSHMEVSEAVLDIERMIFKDLIGETIRDLASLAGKSAGLQALRRKLVF